MKWKILIKLLYLITILSLLGMPWSDNKPKLIDSDPHIEISSKAYHNPQA